MLICFFSTIWLKGFVSYFDAHTGSIYKKILCKFEGYHLWFYFGERDSYEVAEHIAERMIKEDGYMDEVNRNIVIEADKLSTFAKSIPQTNLETLTDDEIWRIYETHHKIHERYYTWGWIPVGVDMFHSNLTKRVKAHLTSLGVPEDKLNKYFVILTQPTEKSLIMLEQEELLRIATAEEEKRGALLKAHRAKYYYTKHLWVSGEYTIEDYLKQLQEIFAIGESPRLILERQEQEFNRALQEREALFDRLKIDAVWRRIFENFAGLW